MPSAAARQAAKAGSEPIMLDSVCPPPSARRRTTACALPSPSMATFTTRFLGCKVSFADEQAIRERLLADGHRPAESGADVAVINTCCVTTEAVAKPPQPARRRA